MRTIYRGSEISRGLKWSVGDRFECSDCSAPGEILELRERYAVVKLWRERDGRTVVVNLGYHEMASISDVAPHVHQWEWDTSEEHTLDDEVVNSIEGMFCACGERLSVGQVRDIVNGVWKVGE